MKASHLYRCVRKNNSLLRAYENEFASKLNVAGKGIDLGAKSTEADYYSYIDMSNVSEMTFVDYFHADKNIIKMDLEETFPIESNYYDFALSFNVMEHIYDYQQFLRETHRVLSTNGRLHGFVPFMVKYHPDPNDYFRYTVQGLTRLLYDSGFKDIKIIALGGGPFKVAASQLAHVIRVRSLRFVIFVFGIVLDGALAKKCRGNETYPLGYYFTGVK